MATVYLAEDLKHHRNVAPKVLKPELAAVAGAERQMSLRKDFDARPIVGCVSCCGGGHNLG